MINQIYHLSCFELFKQIKAENIKVDLILTDPPWNISKPNNFKTIDREGISWDWDYNFDQTSWLAPAVELVNDNGSIIIFNTLQNFYLITVELERLGCVFKDTIRWVKSNPMPKNIKRRYLVDCEYAIWFVKSKKSKWTFNLINDQKMMRPEFKSSVSTGLKRIHPTQKNINVISDLIKIHSNENDLILDPFSGSGAISKGAKMLKRNYLACEINSEYYKKSIELMEDD